MFGLGNMRRFHLVSGAVIGCFLTIHLANHFVSLAGQAEHMAFMRAARPFYRNAIVETLLLALFAAQIVSGTTMLIRGWKERSGRIAWIQAISGLYLAAFVMLHTMAVLSGRLALQLDTDFRFAAAGFHVPGWPWYFWPYYTLAITALFTHLGCALYWNLLNRNRTAATISLWVLITTGFVSGLLIAAALAGKLYSVDIPSVYKASFQKT